MHVYYTENMLVGSIFTRVTLRVTNCLHFNPSKCAFAVHTRRAVLSFAWGVLIAYIAIWMPCNSVHNFVSRPLQKS